MKQWKHELLITFATMLAGWTIFVTWAATRISSFIVYNDDVWERMEEKGYRLEWMTAETIHQMRCVGLFPIVSIVTTCCLAYFWVLYRKKNQQIGPR
jgi:hypothetical protein